MFCNFVKCLFLSIGNKIANTTSVKSLQNQMSKAHCLQKKDRLYLFGLLLIVPKLTLYLSLVLVTVLLFLSDEDTLSVNVSLVLVKVLLFLSDEDTLSFNVAMQGESLMLPCRGKSWSQLFQSPTQTTQLRQICSSHWRGDSRVTKNVAR